MWATGQHTPAVQRRGRYVPESMAHPAKMLPAVAAHAITTYTRPGELVLDPMCGIGTTLVEALHHDRRAVGVEYEARWAEIARTNIDLTGPLRRGLGTVYTGDARHLDWLLPPALHGQAALVVTSPPYGPSTHGRVTTDHTGVHKRHHLYGDLLDRGNLANIGHHRLLAGFTRILTLTAPFLRPGGRVVITVRRANQPVTANSARMSVAAATDGNSRTFSIQACRVAAAIRAASRSPCAADRATRACASSAADALLSTCGATRTNRAVRSGSAMKACSSSGID